MYAKIFQSPRLVLTPIIGGSSTLLIPELTPKDLQNNIVTIVGDALTIALAKEKAAKSVASQNRAELAAPQDKAKDATPKDLGA